MTAQGFDVNGVPEDYGSPEWITVYTQRVDEMLQESNQAGARVVWVGMPLMQDPTLNSEMLQLDAIYKTTVGEIPWNSVPGLDSSSVPRRPIHLLDHGRRGSPRSSGLPTECISPLLAQSCWLRR